MVRDIEKGKLSDTFNQAAQKDQEQNASESKGSEEKESTEEHSKFELKPPPPSNVASEDSRFGKTGERGKTEGPDKKEEPDKKEGQGNTQRGPGKSGSTQGDGPPQSKFQQTSAPGSGTEEVKPPPPPPPPPPRQPGGPGMKR